MALTPEQIAGFRAASEEIAQPVIDWLLRDITERVAGAGKMTSTAAYEIYRAEALGAAKKDLEDFLAKQLGLSNSEVENLFQEAAQMAQEDDFARAGVQVSDVGRATLDRLTSAAVSLAGEELKNITQTTGMVSPLTGKAEPLQKVYQECMDEAVKLVATGATSYSEAARQATRKLAGRGVVYIDYASGVSTELGTAVRRNLMGGMGLLVEQVTQQDHDDLGCDGWEISAHANSAPDHEPIQGRQYSDAEYSRLNESLARRIGTLNCGHVAMPIILGISIPQYTEEELASFREENARGVTWEGRHMTGYEATQYQNRIERNIRTQKRRVLMDEAAGDEEQLITDSIKLTRLNQEYARYNKAMGFKSRAQRLEVVGWGRSQAAKASSLARKQKIEYNKKKQAALDAIRSADLPKTLNRGNQLKHIKEDGRDIGNRSFLYGTLEDAQKLVDKYSGTGEPKMDRKGNWTNKEHITADHIIGVVVDPDTGESTPTHRFSIHYGKRGTHVVPAKEVKE